MGVWDDVDYRRCERCGETRHTATMSVLGPARVWVCTPCAKRTSDALKELADAGQEFERGFGMTLGSAEGQNPGGFTQTKEPKV